MDTVDMKDQKFPAATTPSSPTKDNDTVDMEGQQIPMAITADPPTNDNDTEDTEDQPFLYIHPFYLQLQANSNIDISRSKSSSSSEEFFTPPSSPPPSPINWDEIDPYTGLSAACTIALQIIDSSDYAELRRFNAPLLSDPTLSVQQRVEMYFDGGESEQHRRKRMGEENEDMEMGKQRRASVVDKVAGILAAWKGRALSMKTKKKKGDKAGKVGGEVERERKGKRPLLSEESFYM